MSQTLDELRGLAEALRGVFADERVAISQLDHARLETLAQTKRELAGRLGAIRDAALAENSPAVRDLFSAIRVEARATAMLASTANQAVRALLGYQSNGYGRSGQSVSYGPSRILAAR